MKRLEIYLLAWCTLWLGGCQYLLGGLDIKAANTSVQPPSNVSAYLSVMNGDTPVTELSAKDFKLHENGQPLDPKVTKQTLLSGAKVVDHRTLILLDLSSAEHARSVSRATASLVTRLRAQQSISVYAFDGGPKLHLIGNFDKTSDKTATPDELEGILEFAPSDASRNLNGALVSAVGKLKNALSSSQKPVRVGSLVVFTRGPDLSGRSTPTLRDQTIEASGFNVFAVGPESDDPELDLESIGTSGVYTTADLSALGITFERVASDLIARFRGFYLLSYCSPSRAGMRRLTVEVMITELDGTQKSGSWDFEFDSTGFTPNCDSKTMPRFGAVAAPEAAAPQDDGLTLDPPRTEDDEQESAPPDEENEPAQPAAWPRRNPSGGGVPTTEDEAPPRDEETPEDSVIPPPPDRGYAPVDD